VAIDLGDAILRIKGDTKQLTETFESMRTQVGIAMTAVGVAITGALGGAVSKAADFGERVGNVATLGIENLDALKKGVFDVSQAVGTDLNQGMDALYDIISAGIPEGSAITFLGKAAIASKAGVGELSDAVDLGTTIMNAFGLTTADTGRIFDQTQIAIKLGKTNIAEMGATVGKVAPLFKGAGVASEEMFASLAQLTAGGLSTAESVTGLRAVLNSILKPTGDAKNMAKELEIQWDSNALATKGLSAMMAELAEKTGGNIDQISALIPSVEAMPAAFSLMSNSGADLAAKLDLVKNSTNASQEAYEAWVDANPAEALDRLTATIQVLVIRAGDALVPVLAKLADMIIPVVEGIVNWIEHNPSLTATILTITGAIGALFAVLGPLLLVLPGLVTAFSAVGTIFSVIAAGPIALITLAVGGLIALAAAVISNWETVKSFFVGFWQATKELFADAVNVIIGTLMLPFQVIENLIGAAWNAVKRVGGWIGEMLGFGGGIEGSMTPIAGMQHGGVVPLSGIYNVGESGPEQVWLPKGATVVPNEQLSGGGITLNVNVDGMYVREEADVDRVSESLYGKIMQELSGAGLQPGLA